VTLQPVRAVQLRDRRPLQTVAPFAWERFYDHDGRVLRSRSHVLPNDIFNFMAGRNGGYFSTTHKFFASIEAAQAALSVACIAWARYEAKRLRFASASGKR
jgi:hypothetical protein